MESETTWIDAWIRWDRNSKDVINGDESDDFDTEERVPPTTEFSFVYRLSDQEHDSNTSNPLNINLTLKGFPTESEQIWNSTGLTLWPASHYLCEYLVDHYPDILSFDSFSELKQRRNDSEENTKTTTPRKNIKMPGSICAVELGSGLGRCGLLLHHIISMQENVRSHVYLTDGDTDTLKQLRDNVAENTNQNIQNDVATPIDDDQNGKEQRKSHAISCHQLLWGRDSTRSFCERHFKNFEKHDDIDSDHSQTDDAMPRNSMNLVIGSDLVYAHGVIDPLFETVSVLLNNGNEGDSRQQQKDPRSATNKKSVFLMAHSDRREGSSVTLNMVLEGAKKAGLDYEILQRIEDEGIYVIAFSNS